MPNNVKPLFVPVKSEYYDQMEAGDKPYEIRKYGERWNEKTCAIGREAVISKGYGKKHRFNAKVTQFARLHPEEMSFEAARAAASVYPGHEDFAVFWFERIRWENSKTKEKTNDE